MALTMYDIIPLGLCLATQDLLDTKRYREYFGDNLILRIRDKTFEDIIIPLKRELNSSFNQKKFLDGHKAVIISNIDKILATISSRYSAIDPRAVEKIIIEGKEIIKKVLFADSFENLAKIEPIFKSKITLPVYSLFNQYEKQKA